MTWLGTREEVRVPREGVDWWGARRDAAAEAKSATVTYARFASLALAGYAHWHRQPSPRRSPRPPYGSVSPPHRPSRLPHRRIALGPREPARAAPFWVSMMGAAITGSHNAAASTTRGSHATATGALIGTGAMAREWALVVAAADWQRDSTPDVLGLLAPGSSFRSRLSRRWTHSGPYAEACLADELVGQPLCWHHCWCDHPQGRPMYST
jgi:hypothetical protein